MVRQRRLLNLIDSGKLALYKEAWKAFLRVSLVPQQFPREMMKYRTLAKNEDDYLKILADNFGRSDCFVAMYSNPQIKASAFDSIFFEVDAPQRCTFCNAILKTKDKWSNEKRICATHGSVYPWSDLREGNAMAEK